MIVVVIIGILSAVAIPAFINYVKRSKTTEAQTNIKALFLGAATYYQDEHWDRGVVGVGNGVAAGTKCTVAGESSGNTPNTGKTAVDFAVLPSFVALSFAIADPIYYQYNVVSADQCENPPNNLALYSFQAIGDLDGDGTTSLFEMTAGSSDGNELYRSPGVYRERPLE